MVKKVIWDFDGTLTDVFEEGRPFVEGYKSDISQILGMEMKELEPRWDECEGKIWSNPTKYGWVVAGKIIAPAYADPYQLSQAIARMIMQQEGRDEEFIISTINQLFLPNYRKTGVAFKDGAQEALERVASRYDSYIITNSGTESVQRKLDHLGVNGIHLTGNACKYDLDDTWDGVMRGIVPRGFDRTVWLRRKKYYDAMMRVLDGTSFSDGAVIGDIYEMDLALPNYLGMRTIFVAKPQTPEIERRIAKEEGSKVVGSLYEVMECL